MWPSLGPSTPSGATQSDWAEWCSWWRSEGLDALPACVLAISRYRTFLASHQAKVVLRWVSLSGRSPRHALEARGPADPGNERTRDRSRARVGPAGRTRSPSSAWWERSSQAGQVFTQR